MQDIRDLNLPLQRWSSDPKHPGWQYCYCVNRAPYRIHIAKVGTFKVLGSFPTWGAADATMAKLLNLETEPAPSPQSQGYLHPTEGWVSSSWPA